MATQKTLPTAQTVDDFIDTIADENVRNDCRYIRELLESITKEKATMWGPSIIGFGKYHYKYESGHEGDAPLAAFAPRKDSLVIYMSTEFEKRETLLSQLGKHKSSKSCLYVKKLSDIDLKVLEKIVVNSMKFTKKLYPSKQ